jgi:lipopolysaccharide/colanic/teichoic acid biosynthesis glycosyltransferase
VNRSSMAPTLPGHAVDADLPPRRESTAPVDRRRRTSAGGYDALKRATDVLIAGTALVLLSPVMLATAAMVRAALGGPVLFRQSRTGLHGEIFEALKFRTMLDTDPARGLVEDEERLTRFGRLLRASSLDELPGLLNVLRGDMSLVGPRPLIPQYLERYSEDQERRHDVLPGLTGLAQISGRNSLTWDDRFDLDLHYLRIRGPWTDLRILAGTIPKVLRSEGVTEQGGATMTIFFGPRRIGDHEIRPADARAGGAGTAPSRWEVVERDSGAVVALCRMGVDAGVAEMRVRVVPGSRDPGLVRARGVEMLSGLARERRATLARLVVGTEESQGAPLPTRLGFRPVASPPDPAGSLLEADLGRSDW